MSSLDSSFTEEKHLAAIISLIGSPPQDVLKRGNRSLRYFNDDGIQLQHDIDREEKLSC